MKKRTKKRIITFFSLLLVAAGCLYIFRGDIYRFAVSYKEDGSRKNYRVKDKNLAAYIEGNLPSDASKDIESVIDLSQELTAKALSFSLEIKENDPAKTLLLGRANCVGYAAFASAAGNYLIDKYKLSEVWEAKPVKGKLYVLGYDMHKQTKNKSFKDHDFVIFRNKITKREICADPSLYESARIKRIRKYE
ncbi:MAG TPA: hypothetical protein DIT04_14115 [Dysgonomonas sp.]|nr:hypothetical protein [Dysgonomonas sp.]